MNTLNLRSVLLSGGNIVVDASKLSPIELRMLAHTAKISGGTILGKKSFLYNALECRNIALAGGKGTVTFDFTD